MKGKTLVRSLFLLLPLMLLLAGTAFADSGPKPQLRVRVVNGPAEPYYLDLAAPGEKDGHGLSQEKLEALDQEMLSTLLAAVPEGWHACVAQGQGALIFGDLTGEDGLHTFRYFGVPDICRILIVTQSGETWLSEPLQRKALQSSVTVDWSGKSIEQPPAWLACLLQFLSTLLPTLLIEGALLLLFGFGWRENWKPFLAVNLLTQGALSLWMGVNVTLNGAWGWYFLRLLPAELAIALGEAAVYRRLFRGKASRRAFAYGLAANICSAALGWLLVEPVWDWSVLNCLI